MSARFRPGVLAVLMAFAGWLPNAMAATTSSPTGKGGVTYRWTDDQGVVHYGDSVPPQYAQKERAVLNSRGVEVRTLDAQKTPEQVAAAERAQQEVLKQKQHDAFLMNTYTSVKDIEALRDLRLDQLHGQRVAAEQYVDSLNSRLSALQTRAQNFKPYNSRPAAHRMPDDVAEDLVHTLNELRTQSNALSSKTEEETNTKAQFQADIERYRELRAKIAQP
ncbi:MAG: DUF4124 domain-containing protein [Proteobacteria bacterium]|nr:DUF4124 domain-containing protein [Pseudomonadota bacterium]